MEGASTTDLAILNAILGMAALMASVTGFGYALVAVPLLVLLLPPLQLVPVVLISWGPLALLLIARSWRDLNPGRLARLLAGALLGAPLGILVLSSLPAGTMRPVIGGITLIAGGSLLLRPGRPLVREGPALLAAGLLSGVTGGSTGMSGPPVVLLGLAQRWEPRGFRADLICFFLVLHTSMAVGLGYMGLLSGGTLRLSLAVLPGVLVGYAAGTRLLGRVDASTYRRVAVSLVVAGGTWALLSPLTEAL